MDSVIYLHVRFKHYLGGQSVKKQKFGWHLFRDSIDILGSEHFCSHFLLSMIFDMIYFFIIVSLHGQCLFISSDAFGEIHVFGNVFVLHCLYLSATYHCRYQNVRVQKKNRISHRYMTVLITSWLECCPVYEYIRYHYHIKLLIFLVPLRNSTSKHYVSFPWCNIALFYGTNVERCVSGI